MTRAAVAATGVVLGGTGGRILTIIDGYVVDWSAFIDEHPGGREVLEDYIGRDATSAFEDVAHSTMARRMVAKYIVARIVEPEAAPGSSGSAK